MKFLLLLFLCAQLFGEQKYTDTEKISISWGNNLYLKLNSKGFKSSKDVNVFGSFRIKGEKKHSIELYKQSILYPRHNIVLVHKDYTIYILDLKKQKLIGQFKIPPRGTPQFIKIEPNDKGFTNIKYQFRMLPDKGSKGRPGPLIKKILIYKNGKYSE